MNYLRKRAEDLLTQVALTPEAVDAMVAFAAERVAAERDASKENAERNKWMCEAMQEEIARLRRGHEMKIELTPAVIACLKRGLNCWPEQNNAEGAEIREILRQAEEVKLRIGEDV